MRAKKIILDQLVNIRSIHEGKKPFKCSICDYSCSENLNRHISSVHEVKKPFNFLQESNLKEQIVSIWPCSVMELSITFGNYRYFFLFIVFRNYP